jgi:hypothetical protein
MSSRSPPADKKAYTNIIDFDKARTKAKQDKLLDMVAQLAWHGLDPMTIDALFSKYVTNEKKQAPGVARRRKALKELRETMRMLQKVSSQALSEDMAAKAKAELAKAIEIERGLENEIIIQKCVYLESRRS